MGLEAMRLSNNSHELAADRGGMAASHRHKAGSPHSLRGALDDDRAGRARDLETDRL